MIRPVFRLMTEADWSAVEMIYMAGIATGHATFESTPPNSWEAFATNKRLDLSLVAIDESGRVQGWVAASPVSERYAYRGVVEHSIYIHPDLAGQGVGRALLNAFIDLADCSGVWTIQSSIFPENIASIRLHEQVGFRVIGRRESIALMTYGSHAGQWRDTILLERRSSLR